MHLGVQEATISCLETYGANCIDSLRFNLHVTTELYAKHFVIIVKSEVPGSDHGQLHEDYWRAVDSHVCEVKSECGQINQHRVVV